MSDTTPNYSCCVCLKVIADEDEKNMSSCDDCSKLVCDGCVRHQSCENCCGVWCSECAEDQDLEEGECGVCRCDEEEDWDDGLPPGVVCACGDPECR